MNDSKNEIGAAIKNRTKTHNGIYSDIGEVLEQFSTEELADYYINTLGCENSMRYHLEQQIIASEISREKMEAEALLAPEQEKEGADGKDEAIRRRAGRRR